MFSLYYCLWITQLQNQLQNESYNNLIYIMSIIAVRSDFCNCRN